MQMIFGALILFVMLFCDHAVSKNLFEANLRKRVNLDDDLLNRALWAGVRDSPYESRTVESNIITYKVQNRLRKRITEFEPLIHNPNCLLCPNGERDTAGLTVEKDFSARQLRQKMILNSDIGPCLFYGQRKEGSNPKSLSRSASSIACNKAFFGEDDIARSIWHLWPNDQSRQCEVGYDYYCLDAWAPKCCWLNPLMDGQTKEEREPKTRPYFQQMSEAMASTCTGNVYLLHDMPDDIMYQDPAKEISIWITHEFPMLKQLYRRGVVEKLLVIPTHSDGTADMSNGFQDRTNIFNQGLKREVEVDEELAQWIKERKEYMKSDEYVYRNMTTHFERRWTDCNSEAADEENINLDYFG